MRTIRQQFRVPATVIFAIQAVIFWGLVALIDEFLTPAYNTYAVQYLLYFAVQVLGLYAFGTFDYEPGAETGRILVPCAAGVLTAALAVMPLILLFSPRLPQAAFITLTLTTYGGAVGARVVATRFLGRLSKTAKTTKVIIVGKQARWEKLLNEISDHVPGIIQISGYIEDTDAAPGDPQLPCSIVVADPALYDDPEIRAACDRLRDQGCALEFLPRLAEEGLGRVPLEVATAYRTYYETAFNMVAPEQAKRALDVAVSALALALLLPVIIFISAVVAVDSGFPVFFRQRRIGLEGRPFTIHKFRTMKRRKETEAGFADDHAAYITRAGRFLRRFRLDELPQLWDVLLGRMSLVGPRPEQPEFVESFARKIPFYAFRHALRPGITGWAQVNHPYASNLEETTRKLEYDLFYIKNRSTILDLQILLRTLEAVLGIRGNKAK